MAVLFGFIFLFTAFNQIFSLVSLALRRGGNQVKLIQPTEDSCNDVSISSQSRSQQQHLSQTVTTIKQQTLDHTSDPTLQPNILPNFEQEFSKNKMSSMEV